MQKRVLSLLLLMIISLNFISAATFSLKEILSTIDEGSLIVIFVFIVSFALIFFSSSKLFKTNNTIAAIISLATSFFITYWVSKSDLNLGNLFSNIGISEETLYIIIPIFAIAFAIFLIITLKTKSFLIFGGLLMIASFFIEEQALVMIIGAGLLVVGFLSLSKNKKFSVNKILGKFLKP